MNKLIDRFAREPVLGFGAAGLAISAWWSSLVDTPDKKLALAGVILWLQRTFATSKKSADEQVADAKADLGQQVEVAKYVGAVEHQATVLAGRVASRPLKARLEPKGMVAASAPGGSGPLGG